MGAAKKYRTMCHVIRGAHGMDFLLPVEETRDPKTFLISRKKLFAVVGMPIVKYKRCAADVLGKRVKKTFDFLRVRRIETEYTPYNGKTRRIIELHDATTGRVYKANWDTDKERRGRGVTGYLMVDD